MFMHARRSHLHRVPDVYTREREAGGDGKVYYTARQLCVYVCVWGEEEILNLIFAKGRDLSGISAQSNSDAASCRPSNLAESRMKTVYS